MKIAAITSALLLSLAVIAPVAAAEPPAKDTTAHDSHKQHPAAPEFAALDKNKDGALSKAELAKHPMSAHFGMMDADKDGKLSKSEFSSM